MEIVRDRQAGNLYLSQKSYIKKVLQRFRMQDSKAVGMALAGHLKLSSNLSPSTEEEVKRISNVLYACAVGSLMYAWYAPGLIFHMQ